MAKNKWLNNQMNGTGEPHHTWLPGTSKIWPYKTAPRGSPVKLELLQNLRKAGLIK